MKNGAVSCHTGHFYLEYEPPEGFLEGRIEFSADYWKLGISIYKMLTGHFPFKNEQSIIDDEIPHLQELEISQEAKEILKSLLNKNLFERLGSRKNPRKIKQDLFFKELDWNKLENGQIKPPFKPIVVKNFSINITIKFRILLTFKLKKSSFDVSNFDSELQGKNWDGIELDLENLSEYIEKDFEIISDTVVLNIDLKRLIGSGGFGNVNKTFLFF